MLDDDEDDTRQQESLPSFVNISQQDVAQAANIVQQMYAPMTDPATSQALQRDLFELQKRPEAWGLVAPFLSSPDPQVQFFGAHTAQVKVARDWEQWPILHAHALRNMLLSLTAGAATNGVGRVALRKLYVSLVALALRLCPLDPSLWSDWVKDVLLLLIPTPSAESAPDFLAIAVEEVRSGDLLPIPKTRMQASLKLALPFVMQLFIDRIRLRDDISLSGRLAWMKAVEAWVTWGLPGDELTALVPVLIGLLRDKDSFIATCDVLEEIMTKSALSAGKGTKILTEPLLQWVASEGTLILQESLSVASIDETSHAFCKILLAIGDHSGDWLIEHMQEPNVQTFLRVMLGYTSFPGWYGVDEDESEMTLQFWSAFQDNIIDGDFSRDTTNTTWQIVKSVEIEVVTTLVQKARWPTAAEGLQGWANDQRDKFQNFRRDIGDTLINTYYVLRNELFAPIVPRVVELLASGGPPQGGWEVVEAALFAIKTVQEAVPTAANPYLDVVFGPEVLGRIPTQGREQIRRTTLDLVGAYSTWFHDQTSTQPLMNAMAYVVGAFSELSLSLHAARAMRDLCENNRKALSGHMDSFANLYTNLPSIPDAEKAKVLQAIFSVIQALPAQDAIGPIENVVAPLVGSLAAALGRASQNPEESRAACVAQLQALSGCAKGLTNSTDPLMELSTLDEDRDVINKMEIARDDPRMIQLRKSIIEVLQLTMNIWSADAEVGEAVSELIKAITSLPADHTLLSLPPGPVLELVCAAAQRQTTAVWLSLGTMLVAQLDPSTYSAVRTSNPQEVKEAQEIMGKAAALLVEYTLTFLASPGAMENNPDIVRAFFVFLVMVCNHFVASLLALPASLSSSLMECAIRGLTLPERYSLVDAAKFLYTYCRKSLSTKPEYAPPAREILKQHGPAMSRALIFGIAGSSPRSTIPNLVELLAVLLAKIPEHRTWMKELLYSAEMANPRITSEVKDKFIYVATTSRSTRQTCEAANEFSLVSRGLEGSSFGYATSSI